MRTRLPLKPGSRATWDDGKAMRCTSNSVEERELTMRGLQAWDRSAKETGETKQLGWRSQIPPKSGIKSENGTNGSLLFRLALTLG